MSKSCLSLLLPAPLYKFSCFHCRCSSGHVRCVYAVSAPLHLPRAPLEHPSPLHQSARLLHIASPHCRLEPQACLLKLNIKAQLLEWHPGIKRGFVLGLVSCLQGCIPLSVSLSFFLLLVFLILKFSLPLSLFLFSPSLFLFMPPASLSAHLFCHLTCNCSVP